MAKLEQSFPEIEARIAQLEGNQEAIAALEAKFTALAAQFPELVALSEKLPTPNAVPKKPLPPSVPRDQQATFALVKVLMPVIAAMLDRKLAALETRLLAQLSTQQIPPSLSIRLSAVEPEAAPPD